MPRVNRSSTNVSDLVLGVGESMRWSECISYSGSSISVGWKLKLLLYSYLANKLFSLFFFLWPTGAMYQQDWGWFFFFRICSLNNWWNVCAILPWPCAAQYIFHSMASLPCIQVCCPNEGAISISNCLVAPVISHRECHCCISFEFYKHHNAWALSSKCVY